jgi:hypothetical protein
VVGREASGGLLPGGAHAVGERSRVDGGRAHKAIVRRRAARGPGLPEGARGRILSASPGAKKSVKA